MYIAPLFTIAKTWKQPNKWLKREKQIKEVHIYSGILRSHQENKLMPIVATWMQPEIIMWSKSERERQISYDITCVGNIKYGTNEPTYKTERDSDIENRLGFARWKSGRQLLPYFQKSTKACPLVQFSLVAQSCPTLCNPVDRSTPSLPIHHQLPEFTQTHVHWVGNAIQPSHPLSSPSPLPSIFPSIGVFSNESALRIRWPKYWSFSFNISPSNEHPGLISFRMDWLDLLAVQGTLKSLLQHYNSKASILWYSAFFTVQLSHRYMTTGKTIALTRRTFVDKVMSLLFNMLSRLVITFLPRSKCLLISWLQSPSAVILEPKKIKSATVSTFSSSICHEVMGPDAMILVFWMLSLKPTFSLSSFTFIKKLWVLNANQKPSHLNHN